MKKQKFLSSQRVIIFSFSAMILLGALLLMLPFASRGNTSFLDALFTATSASCVTGLVVFDTASYFTVFGKTVIIVLIQIGGMGVITMAMLLAKLSGKKVGLKGKSLMQDSISAPRFGKILSLTGFIILTTLIIELSGAVLLMYPMINKYGLLKGICYSLFHSVSAFCNAGFDILGNKAPFSSLCIFGNNVIVNVTIMLLIIIGGIGFVTWDDVKNHKFHFSKYRMQTKAVLVFTLFLIFIPAIFFYIFEFSKLTGANRVLASLFQSVTLRTAGFNTVSFGDISESGKLVMIFLMLIGGSSGSTAGGMKVTTFAVMVAAVFSVFKRKKSNEMFGRRIPDETVKNALSIVSLYLTLFILGGIFISVAEDLPLIDCLFETASAIGTVGLTVGITASLSSASKIIIIALMFLGRVGGLTLVFATVGQSNKEALLPSENIIVG
ncbi:MAG: Trk family potassium uptake protein [Clostridia bacterium]|nr:Trk family potassium uptake protein [Clostridia bacterium]